MTWTTENAKDRVKRNMIVVLNPRKRLEDFVVFSGSVYAVEYLGSHVSKVTVNGTELAEGSSSGLSAGQFYQDKTNGVLYVRKSDSTAVASSDWVVITYELYLATAEFYWYRDPLDDTTEEVLYRGVIQEPPQVAQSSSDLLFGFSPIGSTAVGCHLDSEYLQEQIYSASFNEAETVIYHIAGRLKIENIQKIFTGVSGNVACDDTRITINILDKTYSFDAVMTNNGSTLDFGASSSYDGTSGDPQFSGKKIRMIYGEMYRAQMMCVSFIQAGTTSQNRDWAVCTRAYGTTSFAISRIYIIRDNTFWLVTSGYSIINTAQDTVGVRFNNNFEASHSGLGTLNPSTDIVVAQCTGPDITPTILGSPMGDSLNPITVLYHILKDRMGLTTDEINVDSFVTAAAACDIKCSFPIPFYFSADMPTYKEVMTRLLATALARAYFDADGKFTVRMIGPAGDADYELSDEDLMGAQFEFGYDDIADVYYGFGKWQDIGFSRNKNDVLFDNATGTTVMTNRHDADTYSSHVQSSAYQYLHEGSRTSSVDSLVSTNYGATDYSKRLGHLLGERRGRLSVYVKTGAHGLELGDVVSVSRAKLPGFAYDRGTSHTRKFVVVDIRKELGGVSMILDDQKGIEENTGDW